MAENNRDTRIGCTAVVGMALLGVIAMMTQWVKEGWLVRWWTPHDPILTLIVCGAIGAFVGGISMAWVISCLRRTDLRVSMAIVYGTNAVMVCLYVLIKPTGLTGPLSAALVALIGVCALAWLIKTLDEGAGSEERERR